MADFWRLDTGWLCLTVDAFAGGALGVDDVVERTGAIEQGTHQPTFLPIGVFDTPLGFGELRMSTRCSCRLRKEQRTAKALSTKAVGVLKEEGGMHAQAFGAAWSSIGVAWDFFVTMGIEWDGGDALSVSDRLIDVPKIVSGIGGDISRELMGGHDGLVEEGTKIGDIGFIERQGVLGQHDIAIDRISGCRHARAVAKQTFLFDFGAAIRLFLIATFLDAQSTIWIPFRDRADSKGAFDVHAGIVLAYPGVDVLHVKGDGFAQARDSFL